MEKEVRLSDWAKERLEKINWKELDSNFGIKKDSVMNNELVANQLANSQMTNLVYGSNDVISGQFSMRAIFGKEETTTKVFTIEPKKTENDDLYLYGKKIYSKDIVKGLFEMSEREDNAGKMVACRANSNAGKPVSIEINGKKESFLISFHYPTNRLVGMSVNDVEWYFSNKQTGEDYGRQMYGVPFSQEQISKMCKGEAILLEGCKGLNGTTFNTFVQFDAARRQPVRSFPSWVKQALKAGGDPLNMKSVQQSQKAETSQKAKKTEDKSVKRGPRKVK